LTEVINDNCQSRNLKFGTNFEDLNKKNPPAFPLSLELYLLTLCYNKMFFFKDPLGPSSTVQFIDENINNYNKRGQFSYGNSHNTRLRMMGREPPKYISGE
jgi:hypothetical protein